MEKIYLDVTKNRECRGIIYRGQLATPAGVTAYVMPLSDKCAEYDRFAEEYDIHFFFGAEAPEIDFYTLPQVDIFARDSCGGYLGSVGQGADFQGDGPICYIDRGKRCWLVAENGAAFLKNVAHWADRRKPWDGVMVVASLEEAMERYVFLNLRE